MEESEETESRHEYHSIQRIRKFFRSTVRDKSYLKRIVKWKTVVIASAMLIIDHRDESQETN